MSKILIVEPHKMLQKAMALCFFPDHEVKLVGNVPNSTAAIKPYDAVLVDAGALREVNALNHDATRAIRKWLTPTIWMDDNPSSAPKRDKLVALKKPVAKNELISGLAKCLATKPPVAARRAVQLDQRGKSRPLKLSAKGSKNLIAARKQPPIIDAVEKAPARKVQKRARRKNK